MVARIVRSILLLSVGLLMTGCVGETCLEPDDFGDEIVTIDARYKPSEIQGKQSNQIAPWRNSGYKLNGRPLTMVVRNWEYGVNKNTKDEVSAWCPWFSTSTDDGVLSRFCERLNLCTFTDDQMCPSNNESSINNAPCILTKGIGLYALLSEDGVDPNRTRSSMKNPKGIVKHLGEPTDGYKLYDLSPGGKEREAGGLVYDYNEDMDLKVKYEGGNLYFKILDSFYDDNSGQYRIEIKSGIYRANPDPISYVTMLVRQFMFGVSGDGETLLPEFASSKADNIFDPGKGIIRSVYLAVVKNKSYQRIVTIVLVLFVIWTTLSFLSGNVKLTQTEIIIRVMKIGLISALLKGEYSWTFFNDYLFVFFVQGVQQILNIIQDAGATGPGASGILALMIAPQTMAKLFSLLFVDPLGWLYIILFFFALYFIVIIFFNATVIYLSALITIGMIIIMAPIFLCFMLFEVTKSLFENWLKQLISYAIQPMILFTGLIFISVIIRTELYGALGFKVCKHSFPKLSDDSGFISKDTRDSLSYDPGSSIFYWWFPSPMKGENFTKTKVRIPIPIDHKAGGEEFYANGSRVFEGTSCNAYQCFGDRYPDLPFLDPNTTRGISRLNQFWNSKFVQLDGLLLIFASLYLLSKFNMLAIGIARFLTGTSGNYQKLESVRDEVYAQTFGRAHANALSKAQQLKDSARDRFDRWKGRELLKNDGRDLSDLSDKERAERERAAGSKWRAGKTPLGFIGKKIDEKRNESLKKEALSKKAKASILAEVQKKTGMKRSDIDDKAEEKYQASLTDALNKLSMSKERRELSGLKQDLAKAKKQGNKDQERELREEIKTKENLVKNQSKIAELTEQDAAKLAHTMSKRDAKHLQDEFTKLIHGKNKYKDLEGKEKDNIDNLLREHNLNKLSSESDKADRFKVAYANAYADLSDRGVGIVGKNVRAVRGLEEIRHNQKMSNNRQKERERLRGERFYSGIAGVKREGWKAAGGRTQESDIGRTFFGGEYHDINSEDARRRTYAEVMKEDVAIEKRQALAKQVENLNRRYGESVTSPEFLARAKARGSENLGQIQALKNSQIREEVRQALESNENPTIYGETYMRDYAKDSEMRRSVDRIYKAQNSLYDQDAYISRQGEYDAKYRGAGDEIANAYRSVAGDSSRSVNTVDELRSLVEADLRQKVERDRIEQNKELQETRERNRALKEEAENNTEEERRENRREIKLLEDREKRILKSIEEGLSQQEYNQKLKNLDSAVYSYHTSQEELMQLDERIITVNDEIKRQVAGINNYRTQAGMGAYDPNANPNNKMSDNQRRTEVRKYRSIDEHLRKVKTDMSNDT